MLAIVDLILDFSRIKVGREGVSFTLGIRAGFHIS